jgi:hypothetical protein
MLGAARLALIDMSRSNHPDIRPRDNAEIVVVILSDTEDQTTGLYTSHQGGDWTLAGSSNWEPLENFTKFFKGEDTVSGTTEVAPIRPEVTIPVHSIICRNGTESCAETEAPSHMIARLPGLSASTGGRIGPINDSDGIARTMQNIIDETIARQGVKTQKPMIGASLRVAIREPEGECRDPNDPLNVRNGSNVPRSRQSGFDYDGIAQTVSFFGGCRPEIESPVAISYQAWEALDRLPCEDDFLFDPMEEDYCRGLYECSIDQDRCECPPTCNDVCMATHGPGYTCKSDKGCVCERDLG